MYSVILLREVYFIRLIIHSGYYFNKDIMGYQLTAVFKFKIPNK